MKVEGYHFTRGMNNNIINIVDDIIQIHSYDDIGAGAIRKEKLDFIQSGELSFILNKKDFNILRNFNEMDISMKDETIIVQSGKTKLKFQNQTDVKEYQPDLTDPINLNLPIDILTAASEFVGDSDRSKGILVTPDCVAASDGKILYRFTLKTNLDHKISVPPEILKILDKETNYEVKLCNRMIVMLGAGEVVYSSLYEGFVDSIERITMDGEGRLKLKKEELIKHLNLASNFSSAVSVDIEGKKMIIESVVAEGIVQSYSGEIEVTTNIKKFRGGALVKQLLKVLRQAGDEPELKIGNKSYEISDGNLEALALGFTVQGAEPMEVTA